MALYKVTLAYDGTQFYGFQRQANQRTVQEVVENALRALGWQGRAVTAAGRTDTGVHASGQVIAFDLDWAHPPGDLLRALNASLPEDVAAREAGLAPPGFHPRYSAVARRYRYRLFGDATRHPLRERYAWRVWPAVDPVVLHPVAEQLVGTHDFAAFGSAPKAGGSTVRTVVEASWSEDGFDLVFEIVANAFLYHMVRRLVAYQVEIAQGKQAAIPDFQFRGLQGREPSQGLAPAHGLTLVEALYSLESVDRNVTGMVRIEDAGSG
jgi:tRNA pseudouridine38-40 synthase